MVQRAGCGVSVPRCRRVLVIGEGGGTVPLDGWGLGEYDGRVKLLVLMVRPLRIERFTFNIGI